MEGPVATLNANQVLAEAERSQREVRAKLRTIRFSIQNCSLSRLAGAL